MNVNKLFFAMGLIFLIGNMRAAGADTGIDGSAATSSSFTLTGAVSMSTVTVTTRLTVPNGVNSTDAAAYGQLKIIQIVQGSADTAQTNASTTIFSTTTTSASITPHSTSNKIWVFAQAVRFGNTTAGNVALATIMRGATNLGDTLNGLAYSTDTGTGGTYAPVSFNVIDAPATTSSTTYTVAIRTTSGGAAVWNASSGVAYVYLVELAP